MILMSIVLVFFIFAFVYQTKKRFDAEVELRIRDMKWDSYVRGLKDIMASSNDYPVIRDTLDTVIKLLENK